MCVCAGRTCVRSPLVNRWLGVRVPSPAHFLSQRATTGAPFGEIAPPSSATRFTLILAHPPTPAPGHSPKSVESASHGSHEDALNDAKHDAPDTGGTECPRWQPPVQAAIDNPYRAS